MQVPTELWQIIAGYIDRPNPLVYLRLALVCRSAYCVFTCDALWRPVSPQHLKQSYYLNFLARTLNLNADQLRLMAKAWAAVDEHYCQRSVANATTAVHQASDNLYFREMIPAAQNSPDVILPIAIWYALHPRLECPKISLLEFREFFELVVRMEGSALMLNAAFLSDRGIVLSALRTRGEMLEFVPEQFKQDRELILQAVSNFGTALRFVDPWYANDREIVLAAVKSHGWSLQRVSPQLINDKEIVMCAIKAYAAALGLASESLRADKDCVLAAVKQQRWTLRYASQDLYSNQEIQAVASLVV